MNAPTHELVTRRILVALRDALEDAGLSIEHAAHQSGIPESTLRYALSEGTELSINHLDQLCGLLGFKVSELVARAEQPCPSWCQRHPDREPFGHVATLYATGWALTLEQLEGRQPTIYIPEDALENGLDPTQAANLATALHAAVRLAGGDCAC